MQKASKCVSLPRQTGVFAKLQCPTIMAEKLYLGTKVRKLREARGWTLEQCAGRLALSPSYLSQIETNQRPARRLTVAFLTSPSTGRLRRSRIQPNLGRKMRALGWSSLNCFGSG